MATITKTIKPSGGDYTSLTTWEAGRQGNLVAAGNIEVAECYSMVDSTEASIEGWVTNDTNYIKIIGAVSERTSSNTGKFSTDRYRRSARLTVNCDSKAVMQGIQFACSGESLYFSIWSGTPAFKWDIDSCIFSNGGAWGGMVTIPNTVFVNSICNIFNCVFYSATANVYAIYHRCPGVTVYAYNNTFTNLYSAVQADANCQIKAINNLSSNISSTVMAGTFLNGTNYNSTSKNTHGYTVTGGGNTNDRVNQTFTFADAATFDFHIAVTDAGAKGFGVTDPGAGLFAADTDGQTRSAPWDIGADQYVSAEPPAGTVIPVIIHHLKTQGVL